MTINQNYEITLDRNPEDISAMLALFTLAHQIESTSISVFDKDEFTLNQVSKEALKIDIDYTKVEKKFYLWKFHEIEQTFSYNADESVVLIKLWHKAIEQLDKHEYLSGIDKKDFLFFYNKLFGRLANLKEINDFKKNMFSHNAK